MGKPGALVFRQVRFARTGALNEVQSPPEISALVFAPLREFDEGEEVSFVSIRHLLPDRHRRRPVPPPFVEEREFPRGVPDRLLAAASREGGQKPRGLGGTSPGQKEAGRGEPVTGMGGGLRSVRVDQFRQSGREGRQRKDVEAVMLKHIIHEPPVAAAQPVEIALRNLAAGDITLALEAEEDGFQRTEAAIGEPVAQQPPGGMEEIEMGQSGKGIGHTVHDEAGGEKIGVEGLAVEADEEPFPADEVVEVAERRPFFAVITREELAGDEGVPLEPARADEEGHRPGPSRKAGGFGIEEEGSSIIQPAKGRIIAQDGHPLHVEGRQVPDAETAVAR